MRVAEPGVYTWRVTTRSDRGQRRRRRAAAASPRRRRPSRSRRTRRRWSPAASPASSRAPARPADARTVVRAPGIGLDAAVVPTDRPARPHDPARATSASPAGCAGPPATATRIGTTVIAGHVSDRHDRPGALWGLRPAHRGQAVTVVGGAQDLPLPGDRHRDVRPDPDRCRAGSSTTTGPHRLVLVSCTDRVVYDNGHFHYTKYQVVVAKPWRPSRKSGGPGTS